MNTGDEDMSRKLARKPENPEEFKKPLPASLMIQKPGTQGGSEVVRDEKVDNRRSPEGGTPPPVNRRSIVAAKPSTDNPGDQSGEKKLRLRDKAAMVIADWKSGRLVPGAGPEALPRAELLALIADELGLEGEHRLLNAKGHFNLALRQGLWRQYMDTTAAPQAQPAQRQPRPVAESSLDYKSVRALEKARASLTQAIEMIDMVYNTHRR